MADQRQSITEIRRHYCRSALALAVVLSLPLWLAGERLIGKGLILGALFSIANFSLMSAFIPLRVAPAGRRRSLIVIGSLLLRYVLLAAPVVLAHFTGWVSVIGVAAGLFMVQFTILAEHIRAHLGKPLEMN